VLVMCDIDGCVADVREIVAKYLPDWEEYYRHQMDCLPIPSVVRLIGSLVEGGTEVIFVTGRPICVRADTAWWLRFHVTFGYKQLLMRDRDFVGSTQDLKLQWFHEYHPQLIVDDDPSVVKLATLEGFVVLQVHGYRWSGSRDYAPGEAIPARALSGRGR